MKATIHERRVEFCDTPGGSNNGMLGISEEASTVRLPPEETNVVRSVFEELADIIPPRLVSVPGVQPIGKIDVRANGMRMFYSVPTSVSSDRLVIYKKAREKDALEFHFVPEFSFTGGSSARRTAFKEYIWERRAEIEKCFGLGLQLQKPMDGYMDQLVVTAQAWKGFFYRITRPLSEWSDPAFPQYSADKFIEFVTKALPLIKEFDRL